MLSETRFLKETGFLMFNLTPEADEDESLMISLFLDFLRKDVMKKPDQLVVYTEEMSAEIDELLKGVEIEE